MLIEIVFFVKTLKCLSQMTYILVGFMKFLLGSSPHSTFTYLTSDNSQHRQNMYVVGRWGESKVNNHDIMLPPSVI